MVIKSIKGMQGMLLGKQRGTPEPEDAVPEGDSPEANIARGVKQFCESVNTEPGDEVLHLPVIVESAESSPKAAAVAANLLRKYLTKDNYNRPQVQYNAVMLMRILADNPGPSFTKNLDQKFASTMKQLLRESRDQSVQQIARETLSALYQEKAYDTNLSALFAMWTKEQPGQIRSRPLNAPPFNLQQQQPPPMGFGGAQQHDHFAHGSRSHGGGLPPPAELAARVEEAKTSAKLLQQLVQSTPPAELQSNDLVKEFGQRVSAAQKSIQGYINSENPPPDEDTLQTLIETSEQLSLAASKHQRAILQSRRLVGTQTPPAQPGNPNGYFPGGNQPNAAPTVPTLSAPPLPIRTGSNGLPTSSPAPARQSSLSQGYQPPAGPPPSQSPTNGSPQSLYSAPMPSASMQANLQRRANPKQPPSSLPSQSESRKPSLPPMVLNNEPIELPSSTPPGQAGASKQLPHPPEAEDPFSDEHVSPHPIDSVSYGQPPARQLDPATARRAAGEERTGSPTGSPTSYHPGYQSTPSYIHRQESAGNKLMMHGGADSPPPRGSAPAPNRTGSVAERSDVSDATATTGGYSDGLRGAGSVSPLYERHGEAGYRY